VEAFSITGGTSLEGTVHAAGAKNAMTKLLVASLLSDRSCVFHNVPDIGDVAITVDLCREIGMEITWDREARTIEARTKHLKTSYIPQRFSGSNRIPILMIGALLGRTTEDIIVPTVGGCPLGKRPVDFHLAALQKMGAEIDYREMKREGAYLAHAHGGLHGAVIELPYPSVGATENVVLAAVRAKGTTILKNAAMEPEIVDLLLFLQKLGALITVEVDRTIRIEGTQTFYDVEHTVVTDRIEAASWGLAGILTKGKVFVEGAQQTNMTIFLNYLRKLGGGISVKDNGIEFFYDGPLRGGIHLETDVHPGFLTDWQQPFVVLLSQAEGISVVHETVYENRFGYVQTLQEMGAEVALFKDCLGGKACRFSQQNYAHSLVIKGPTPLHAAQIHVPDLRAGFAYLMAALVAEGTSTIFGVPFLERGYEHVDQKLASLGAQIQRTSVEPLRSLEDTINLSPAAPIR
jgi:UDP-N-acetylglucosamine 1-carboxyvinyltransferase